MIAIRPITEQAVLDSLGAPRYGADVEGYVVMDLRINAEGRVEDVRVVREKPEGVFRASALRVVRRWAFMPPAEPAWQRLTIRYELEK